jgi:hypothetical protein
MGAATGVPGVVTLSMPEILAGCKGLPPVSPEEGEPWHNAAALKRGGAIIKRRAAPSAAPSPMGRGFGGRRIRATDASLVRYV